MDKNNKKIFITIPWFTPAYKAGGPIQSILNLVNNFHDGIQYYIFCGDTDIDRVSLNNVQKSSWISFNDWTKVWYATHEERSKTLTNEIDKIKPDVLFIVGLYDWHYNIVPLLFVKGPKKIVSVRGMLHPGALSQKTIKKKLFLTLMGKLPAIKKACFHATDEKEASYIRKTFPGTSIHIAANFPKKLIRSPVLHKDPGHVCLVSIALISPMKNHLLLLEALAHSTNRIDYEICGSVKDPVYWEECRSLIKKLPANISVRHFDNISPDQVEAVLLRNHVFILPSKSENFGHALFEALSAGKPVITSKFTPWQGLEDAGAGYNVELTKESILQAIENFVQMDNHRYTQACERAKIYSENALNFSDIHNQYSHLFGITTEN